MHPKTHIYPHFYTPYEVLINMYPRNNTTGGAPFYWTSPPRPMPTKTGKRNPAKFFRQGKKLPSTPRISHASQNSPNERNTVFLNPRHVLCQPRLGREHPAKFFCQGKTIPSTPSAPQKHLHPQFSPLLHLISRHDPTRDRDRPHLTRWSRGSLSRT